MNKEVDIFIPCSVDQFCPNVASDLISLVEKLGFKANYRNNQTCCGRVLYDNGNWKQAKDLGEKFINDFKGSNIVVGCSAACIGYIKTRCANLFHNTSNHNPYKSLAERLYDITEFIHSVRQDCDVNSEFPFKVFLHNNCQSVNAYNVEQETRLILQKVKGLTLVNDEGNNFCCGGSHSILLHNKPVSDCLAKAKTDLAMKLGADYITSTDTACLLRLQNYIDEHKIPLKTIHIVSLLVWKDKQQADNVQ